jgi:hypothetical protein
MHSLRARLLAAVLALTAAGLLLLGGITYVGQRAFLLDRLDDQIRAAPPVAARALDVEGGPPREPRGGDGPPPGSGLPPAPMSSTATHREPSTPQTSSPTANRSPPIPRCRPRCR